MNVPSTIHIPSTILLSLAFTACASKNDGVSSVDENSETKSPPLSAADSDSIVAREPVDSSIPDKIPKDTSDARLNKRSFTEIVGTVDLNAGLSDQSVYGELLGTEVVEMTGGLGISLTTDHGRGTGGGWRDSGAIDTAGYGNIGRVGPDLEPRLSKPATVQIGSATVIGDLDKNIVRRYIRRKLARIRHCYEGELLVNSKLKGKVVTKFTIGAIGTVSVASAKGFSDRVDSCIVATIKGITFPRPKDAGSAAVRYSFTFQPGA